MKPSVKPKPKAPPLKPGEKRPRFDSVFDPTGVKNPLDGLEYTGDLEKDAGAEMSEALRAIIEQKRAMRETYRLTTDPEFWFAVCFQSREQKDEFLKLVGWAQYGDKYLDGLKVAEALGVAIEPINLPRLGAKPSPKLLRSDELIIGKNDGQGGDS